MNNLRISPTFVIDLIAEQIARQEVADRYPSDCPICKRKKSVELVGLYRNAHGLREHIWCRNCIYDVQRMVKPELVSVSEEK